MWHSEEQFQSIRQFLEIKKMQITYPGGLKKIGVGRPIDGAKAMERLVKGKKK
jgi:hypothetical protein